MGVMPVKMEDLRKAKSSPRSSGPGSSRPGRDLAMENSDDSPLRSEEEAIAAVLARNAYVREKHYFLMRLVLVLAGLLSLSVVGNVLLATRAPENKYFLSDVEGKIREIVPLDRPVESLPVISAWVANAVSQSLTFSFANYRQEFANARQHFTPQGWAEFERALIDSGLLRIVRENMYVTTAVPSGAPVLSQQGLMNGRYAWRFQIPMVVSYESAAQRMGQNMMVTVTVIRVPETENPRGLGIVQIVAQ